LRPSAAQSTPAPSALETGAPVMVHTNANAQTGVAALEFLIGRGVDPTVENPRRFLAAS
jgi:predicted metal-dependent phosphotriesterase family hydrolase